MAKNKKIKILIWGDTPRCSTGFGNVINGIFTRLAKTKRYEMTIIGINDIGGYYDPMKYPHMKIFPAAPATSYNPDFHGRPTLLNVLLNRDPEILPDFDIVFLLNDPFILEQPVFSGKGTMEALAKAQYEYILKQDPETWWKSVYYIPIDSVARGEWVRDAIALADYPVAYTRYGADEILKANASLFAEEVPGLEDRMSMIYHGYDEDYYFPISEQEKKDFRLSFFEGRVKPETFLVTIVGRNQMRKDIPRALRIFAEFKKRRPDSMLYINAKKIDAWGDIEKYAFQFGLKKGEDYILPDAFNERLGYKKEVLNKIYNVSDVILSTNLGEGFGMTYIEAMGAGTLNLAPFHTTTPEIFGLDNPEINEEARGIAFKAGSNLSEFVTLGPQDLERVRPVGNVEDAVQKLLWIWDNPEKAKEIASNGHKWIQNYTWTKIADVWDQFFQKVYEAKERDIINGKQIKEQVAQRFGVELPENAK